jgi:co-chaperonin GroES (HSP10)
VTRFEEAGEAALLLAETAPSNLRPPPGKVLVKLLMAEMQRSQGGIWLSDVEREKRENRIDFACRGLVIAVGGPVTHLPLPCKGNSFRDKKLTQPLASGLQVGEVVLFTRFTWAERDEKGVNVHRAGEPDTWFFVINEYQRPGALDDLHVLAVLDEVEAA